MELFQSNLIKHIRTTVLVLHIFERYLPTLYNREQISNLSLTTTSSHPYFYKNECFLTCRFCSNQTWDKTKLKIYSGILYVYNNSFNDQANGLLIQYTCQKFYRNSLQLYKKAQQLSMNRRIHVMRSNGLLIKRA